jgi:hypothetical protein
MSHQNLNKILGILRVGIVVGMVVGVGVGVGVGISMGVGVGAGVGVVCKYQAEVAVFK